MQPAIARFLRKSAMTIPLVLGLSDVTLFSQSARPGAKTAHPPTIGFIQNRGDSNNEGCILWLRGDRSHSYHRVILLSEFNDRAIMNIGGQDMALEFVDTTNDGKGTIGARSMDHYRGEGVDVVVRYVLTGHCKDEGCEDAYYNATLTVKTSSGKQVMRAHGACGG
jgi:hypothetical protein